MRYTIRYVKNQDLGCIQLGCLRHEQLQWSLSILEIQSCEDIAQRKIFGNRNWESNIPFKGINFCLKLTISQFLYDHKRQFSIFYQSRRDTDLHQKTSYKSFFLHSQLSCKCRLHKEEMKIQSLCLQPHWPRHSNWYMSSSRDSCHNLRRWRFLLHLSLHNL